MGLGRASVPGRSANGSHGYRRAISALTPALSDMCSVIDVQVILSKVACIQIGAFVVRNAHCRR